MLSKSLDDTAKIANILIKEISKNINKKDGATIVALHGDLGAGKTTLTKAVAKILKIKNIVNSPTFIIMKKYPIKFGVHKNLYHFDAYRLKNAKEILHLGFDEILADKKNLVFVEWPQNIKKALPKEMLKVFISVDKKGNRQFKFK